MADLGNSEKQDGHIGCQACTRRSDWDFLKAFYEREEITKEQIQGLHDHIVQLNEALHYVGVESQEDSLALKKAHKQLEELQAGFHESNAARARLENALHEARQRYRMSQENFNYERARYIQTEKSLECIWNSHNKLEEIMSRVKCEIESDVQVTSCIRYNITDLVLETSAKSQRIDKLESTLKETRNQHSIEVLHLKHKLQFESAQNIEDYMNHRQQIHHLNLLLQQREQMKGSMEESVERSRNKDRSIGFDERQHGGWDDRERRNPQALFLPS